MAIQTTYANILGMRTASTTQAASIMARSRLRPLWSCDLLVAHAHDLADLLVLVAMEIVQQKRNTPRF